MNPITLPGTLPGLLQPGCPVLWKGERGILVPSHPSAKNNTFLFYRFLGGRQRIETVPMTEVALDLTEPAGWDRAVRWLGERCGLPDSKNAPSWHTLQTCCYLQAGSGDTYAQVGFAPTALAIRSSLDGVFPTVFLPDLPPVGCPELSPIERLRVACLAMADQPPVYTHFLEEKQRREHATAHTSRYNNPSTDPVMALREVCLDEAGKA